MCGFAGVLLGSLDQNNQTVNESLERMSAVIAHRGPDDDGKIWSGPCGMVHRRLSIIDLSSAGHQPMSNEDGSVVISYNGEVYNFQELRLRFGLDSEYRFKSRTDTEVLLHLYEKLGTGFLKHLNGMFSLAIWDANRQRLLLARDPFGIKPLFYMQHRDGFWFASEIKSLLQAPSFHREANEEALFHYLSCNYIPGNFTPFSGIHELSPGTAMELKPGSGTTEELSFFDFDYTPDFSIDKQTAVEESLRLLQASVDRQLVSDVPVGVMLSGGMDSSALAALMTRARGNSDFHTFSLGFEESSFDESSFARLVANSLGTSHHEILVTPAKVSSLLPAYLAHIDEPYGDGSAIPTWLLAEEASSLVTVLLSGEGGDELFAGYDTHAAMKARKLYRKLVPGTLRRNLVAPVVNMLPVSHSKLSFEFKAKRFTHGSELGLPESHFAWREVLTGENRLRVFQGASDLFNPSESFFKDAFNSFPSNSDLAGILRIDSSCHLPHDLMIKNDRMTMVHSIEARVPFTDTELFRMLAAVPDGLKLPGMKKKFLLKEAMKGILPPSVISKKKVGLEMPYSSWFRTSLKEQAHDEIFSSSVYSSGLLNRKGVQSLWDDHQAMKTDNGRALWGILNYALWYNLYIASEDYLSYIRPGRKRF
jgi:asparagine synthase (glutamine-hydrolysing)